MSKLRAKFFKAFQTLPSIVRCNAHPDISALSDAGINCLPLTASLEDYDRFFQLYEQTPVQLRA